MNLTCFFFFFTFLLVTLWLLDSFKVHIWLTFYFHGIVLHESHNCSKVLLYVEPDTSTLVFLILN